MFLGQKSSYLEKKDLYLIPYTRIDYKQVKLLNGEEKWTMKMLKKNTIQILDACFKNKKLKNLTLFKILLILKQTFTEEEQDFK